MTPIASILICGKIRDRDAFREDIKVYKGWLKDQRVAKIVFSGWVSDLTDNKEIFTELRDMGAQVVLTPEPNFVIRGHIYHQMKTLHFGLAMFEGDDIVIKSRTDRVWLNIKPEVVADQVAHSKPTGRLSPFSSRVNIICGLAFHPFFYNDIMYAGYARDLKQLLSFDIWYDAEGAIINAEQILHSAPILPKRPFLRDFYKVNPGLQHGSSEIACRVQQTLLTDRFYLRCLWDSLATLRDGYRIGLSERSGWTPPIDAVTLEDLADLDSGNPVQDIRYHRGANSPEFFSDAAVEYLLTTPISAKEPRSLTDMFSGEDIEPQRTGPLFSGPSVDLAQKLVASFPELELWKPPPPSTMVVHGPHRPYVKLS